MNDKTKEAVRDILNGFAIGAGAIANASDDPKVDGPARIAHVLLASLARLLEDRTAEEAEALLLNLASSGTRPLTRDELDEQTRRVLASLSKS